MKSRKSLLIFGVILIVLFGVMGCPIDDPIPEVTAIQPIEGNPSGTASASAAGFARDPDYLTEHDEYGKEITVTVTLADGLITEVVIDGPDETPAFGGRLIASIPAVIKAKNTFDLARADLVDENGVNVVSGATRTFDGIKNAGNAAIEEIKTNSGD